MRKSKTFRCFVALDSEDVLVEAIKGVDNPADLGTKALSRDKIKKYLKAEVIS